MRRRRFVELESGHELLTMHCRLVHFGWYEYTTDALFWKRPRLHSWFELCSYETPCVQAAARIEEALQAIDYWPSISVDVPTNKLRRNMRKDI